MKLVTYDHPLWLAWEIFANAGGAALVCAPLYWGRRHAWLWLAAAAAVGVGIDIDHALAAGSIDSEDMLSLGGRPPGHSLLALAAASGLTALLFRRRHLALLAALALASHLLRDASGGHTPLSWPWDFWNGLPWIAYPLGLPVLALLAWRLRNWAWREMPQPTA